MQLRYALALAATAGLVAGAALARPAPRSAAASFEQPAPPDAPAFSVERYSDQRSLTLNDVRGKVALLYFFFPT